MSLQILLLAMVLVMLVNALRIGSLGHIDGRILSVGLAIALAQVAYFTDVNQPRASRVEQALRSLALVVADEPGVAAACTTALLSGDDETVRKVRDRIGGEIHKRIRSAVGPDADPRLLSALEMTYFGALVNAGSGAYTYHQIADRLAYVVGLIVGDNA